MTKKPLIIFAKSSILDVWHGSKYVSEFTLTHLMPLVFFYSPENIKKAKVIILIFLGDRVRDQQHEMN